MKRSVFILVLALIACFSACTRYADENDFLIELLEDGKTAEIIGYTGNEQIVNIPPRIGGIPVTGIGGEAFADAEIVELTIPNGVTYIKENTNPFISTFKPGLRKITIPSSVNYIGWRTFNGTAWLDSQPDGLLYAGKVLYRYKGEMPDKTVINNIRKDTVAIAGRAFSGHTGLTSITIPMGVTSIGEGAFAMCSSLTSVTIPASVTSIGNANNKIDFLTGFDGAFAVCSNLTSIIIPSNVTFIGPFTFYACTSLTSVTIPSSVTSIGESVFRECTNLTSVTIQEGVTSIGAVAFSGCTSLTSVTIPSSVTSIGIWAFNGWTSSKTINIKGKASQAAADAAWGTGWRNGCNARIVYQR